MNREKNKMLRNNKKAWLVYGPIALLIMLPLLRSGYIFALDMVFTPRLAMPDAVTASYLFRAGLHFLNILVPAEIIEKTILIAILLLSGIGMHRLMQYIKTNGTFGTYIAGTLYMINPYTYSRFMAGQYSVLLGYSMLPFFTRALLNFLAKPSWASIIILSGWALLISIVSVHTIGLTILLSTLAVGLYCWQKRNEPSYLPAVLKYGFFGLVGVFVASSYWLIPFLLGKGKTAQTISQFSAGDRQAFATLGANAFGKLGNVLRLQGFWAEGRGLYVLPQDQVVAWKLILLCVWALVIIGLVTMWRSRQQQVAKLFIISAIIASVLGAGVFSTWLADTLPLFAGYREPQKFVGLIALGYAACAGWGANSIIQYCRRRLGKSAVPITAAITTLIVLLFTPVMFWGFAGQLSPRHYPDDWFVINKQLNQDSPNFQVLFLPWHLYMYFSFAERIIANPAPQFFDKPTVSSGDPEFGAASLVTFTPSQKLLDGAILPTAAQHGDLGSKLAPLGIKYILFAKESDAYNYDYLDYQKDLKLQAETATLKLYRNEAFQGK